MKDPKVSFHFYLHRKMLPKPSLSKNTLQSYSVLLHRLFSGQLWHKGSQCYANTVNSLEHSNRPLTVSHQRNPKSVFKYSLSQQSNNATRPRRALSQCQNAGWVWAGINITYLHIMTNIFDYSHWVEVVVYLFQTSLWSVILKNIVLKTIQSKAEIISLLTGRCIFFLISICFKLISI